VRLRGFSNSIRAALLVAVPAQRSRGLLCPLEKTISHLFGARAFKDYESGLGNVPRVLFTCYKTPMGLFLDRSLFIIDHDLNQLTERENSCLKKNAW
jgi:hypothetical protein